MELDKVVSRYQTKNAFKVAQKIKEMNLRPDNQTYHHLLRACDRLHYPDAARAVYEDMINVGVQPRLEDFVALLQVTTFSFVADQA